MNNNIDNYCTEEQNNNANICRNTEYENMSINTFSNTKSDKKSFRLNHLSMNKKNENVVQINQIDSNRSIKSIKLIESKSSKQSQNDKSCKFLINENRKCNINFSSPNSKNTEIINDEIESIKNLSEPSSFKESTKSIKENMLSFKNENESKYKINVKMTALDIDISNRRQFGNDENIFYEDYDKSDYELNDDVEDEMSIKDELIVADLNNSQKNSSPITDDINSDTSEKNDPYIYNYNINNADKNIDEKINFDNIEEKLNDSEKNKILGLDLYSIENKSESESGIGSKYPFEFELKSSKPPKVDYIDNKNNENEENINLDDNDNNSNKTELFIENEIINKDNKELNNKLSEEDLQKLLSNFDKLTVQEMNSVFRTIFNLNTFNDEKINIKSKNFSIYDYLSLEDNDHIGLFFKVRIFNLRKSQKMKCLLCLLIYQKLMKMKNPLKTCVIFIKKNVKNSL